MEDKNLEEGLNMSPPASPGTKLAQKTTLKLKINPLLLAIPAACDICGSSLMFVGLTQCAASVYQMLRGAVVILCAILSVVFLKRKQYAHHIISIAMIVGGVVLVGYSAISSGKSDGKS